MSRRKIWLWSLLAITIVITGLSQVRWDLIRPRTISPGYTDFISKDPAFLYLVFADKPNAPVTTTWLHPVQKSSGSYQESYMPGHEKESRAFAFSLVRESPEGYEVSFQPIDSQTEVPLPAKDIRLFFTRSTHKAMSLTDRTSVSGFYGNPQQRPP